MRSVRRFMIALCRAATVGVVAFVTACGGGGGGGSSAPVAPAISTQPQAQTVAIGQTATFSVSASGTAPLSYQWSRNGVVIAGATASTFTTPATVAGDSGSTYTVVVSNSAGQATSGGAVLTANMPVTITSQPQSQGVLTGAVGTFSVTASGTPPLTYQWRKNGTNIAGATAATYDASIASLADTGTRFSVVVTNSVGSVTSADATVTANANPEGIYSGTLTPTGGGTQPVFAIVQKNGTAAVFVTVDMPQPNVPRGLGLHGVTITTNGAAFSSTFTAYTQLGYLINGLPSLAGSIAGTVTPGVSITGTFTAAAPLSGTFTLTAATADYARMATGTAIQGLYNYRFVRFDAGVPGDVFEQAVAEYDANGGAVPHNAPGCVGGGGYSIPDAAHNVYEVTNNQLCNGVQALAYTGLMALFPAGTGAAVNSGVNFTSDTLLSEATDPGSQTAYFVIGSK